ncbi:MAG: hypothetical protein Q9184_007773 [Pyrenodesmia sp. 2 TL-2023]
MEVVGLIANIGQLIEITAKTIKYLNSVKDASKDRLNVARETSGLLPLLWDLRSRVDANKNEEWSRCIRFRAAEHGPIDQLREALEQLAKKLKPKKGLKDALRTFVWTLDKAYTQEILGKIERVKSSIRKLTGVVQRRESILEWLSPLNFYKNQQDTFARREEGTGQWFIDSPVFQDWLFGSDRTLCCPGIPSVVVDFLRARYTKQESVGVAVIYCNFKERDSQTYENLLAGCSAQLVRQILPESLVTIHRIRSAQKTRPTREEMILIFEDIVTRLDTAYLIVDALDECSEDVRGLLLTFFETLPTNTRLLVTTRHIDEITGRFRSFPMVEIRASLRDLRKYVASRIGSNRRLSGLVRDHASLGQEICDKVAAKADGMFLATKLHVDALSTKTSVKLLKKALENLASDINVLYDDALLRIKSQSQDDRTLAERALRWVAFTYRPLRVEALQEALAIEPGDDDFDMEAIHRIGLVLDVCAGLLIHDGENKTVRLVHYTAQDYFDAHAQSTFDKAHTCIARECITYLSYECFQNHEGPSDDRNSDTSNAQSDDSFDDGSIYASVADGSRYYYLLYYASAFWAQHAMRGQDTAFKKEVHHFLTRGLRVDLLSTLDYDWYVHSFELQRGHSSLRVRHGCEIAAFFGLHDDLDIICERIKKAQPHLLNGSFHLAVLNGQARSVEILLDHGVYIDSEDEYGDTALIIACSSGDLGLVRILLAHGSDTNVLGFMGHPPLQRAVLRCHESCVLALLDYGADSNVKGNGGLTALHQASSNGDLAILNLLAAHNSDLDARNQTGRTPLLMAAEKSHEHCVLALIRHGANVNSKSEGGMTALHVASMNGDLAILNLLAAHDSDLDARNQTGRTPLLMAAEKSHEHCVLALIRHGANVNIQDDHGISPLHLASATGTSNMVAELVQHSARDHILLAVGDSNT